MIDRAFTAKAMSKAIAYANVGRAPQCKAWLEALIKEIDPKGDCQRVEAGDLKEEDRLILEAKGYWPKLEKPKKEAANA